MFLYYTTRLWFDVHVHPAVAVCQHGQTHQFLHLQIARPHSDNHPAVVCQVVLQLLDVRPRSDIYPAVVCDVDVDCGHLQHVEHLQLGVENTDVPSQVENMTMTAHL